MSETATPHNLIAEIGPFAALYSAAIGSLEALVRPQAALTGNPKVASRLLTVINGVARIEIKGILTKNLSYEGTYITLTAQSDIQAAVQRAVADPNVKSIALYVDSPGGAVAGTAETARIIRSAAATKPVWAYVSDLCASGAYWLASGATRIHAGATAIVGSIGAFAVLVDASGWADRQGVRVHVVGSGPLKGTGTLGAAVTPDQLAQLQRTINALADLFAADVATGRKLSTARIKSLADGSVHVGAAAQSAGLIDAVSTWEEMLNMMQSPAKQPTTTAAASAATNNPIPAASRPGASSMSKQSSDLPTRADAKDQATREWQANVNNCRQTFVSEAAYVGFRTAELRGQIGPRLAKGSIR